MVIENGILKYLEKKDVSDGILTIPKEVIEISSTFVDPVPWKLYDWHSGISRDGSRKVEWLEDTISITYKGKPEIKKVIFEEGSKLTKIDIGAFTNFRELEELELPDSVTEIGDWFCRKCTSLKKVKLPKKLKKIGENSFYNCHNLEYVFGSRETEGFNDLFQKSEYVIEYTTEKRGNVLTTQNVESLKDNDNIIVSGVKEIGANTFCGFKKVENIIIEEGVKIIGNYAFTGCENLKRVTLPNSLEYIGDSAFERCESLESIIITPPELNRNKDAFIDSNSKVNLPSKIKFIGKKAFKGCEKITEVILPEKLNALSDFMFKDCKSLQTVEKKYVNGLKQIGANVFQNCTNLENFGEYGQHVQGVEIPKSVKEIGAAAFEGCEKIIKVILPNKISKLGESTFANCFSLVNVNLPKKLTDIGNECFKNCRKMPTIVLSKEIENIGINAFEGCSELHTVVSGHNDEWFWEKGIRENAFKGCPNVEFTLGVEDNSATKYQKIGGEMYGRAYVPKKKFPITFANILNAITNNKGLGR